MTVLLVPLTTITGSRFTGLAAEAEAATNLLRRRRHAQDAMWELWDPLPLRNVTVWANEHHLDSHTSWRNTMSDEDENGVTTTCSFG